MAFYQALRLGKPDLHGQSKMYRDAELDREHLSSSSSLLTETECSHRQPESLQRKSIQWGLHFTIHVMLLLVSVLVYHALLDISEAQSCQCRDVRHEERVIRLRFNGTFDRSGAFKGPPSAAVEKAWDEILPVHVMRISEDKFRTLNASKHAVRLPPKAGGGRMALFEAFHLVHCVRSLWQATYPDYYLKNDDYYRDRIEEWREHTDHCADMLRQKLMCDADSTIITYNWLKKHSSPHPNFNVQHDCRDYDALREAAQVNRVDSSMVPQRGKLVVGDLVDFAEPPFDPNADE